MDNQQFVRCFIDSAVDAGKKKYGSAMAYAKQIWPDKEDKTAAQTLYAIQGKSSKTGKPQNLRLEEACKMVGLLDGYSRFSSFCFEVEERLRMGWEQKNAGVEIQKKEACSLDSAGERVSETAGKGV